MLVGKTTLILAKGELLTMAAYALLVPAPKTLACEFLTLAVSC